MAAGFEFKKCAVDNMKRIMERQDVIMQRHNYLREIKKIRQEIFFHIKYIDETWCNECHTIHM